MTATGILLGEAALELLRPGRLRRCVVCGGADCWGAADRWGLCNSQRAGIARRPDEVPVEPSPRAAPDRRQLRLMGGAHAR